MEIANISALVGFFITALSATGAWLYTAGKLTQKVENNTKDIEEASFELRNHKEKEDWGVITNRIKVNESRIKDLEENHLKLNDELHKMALSLSELLGQQRTNNQILQAIWSHIKEEG